MKYISTCILLVNSLSASSIEYDPIQIKIAVNKKTFTNQLNIFCNSNFLVILLIQKGLVTAMRSESKADKIEFMIDETPIKNKWGRPPVNPNHNRATSQTKGRKSPINYKTDDDTV